MLDCGGDQSPGGDQSNSPDSDPSAESTYGLEARVPARVLNTEMSEAALLEAVWIKMTETIHGMCKKIPTLAKTLCRSNLRWG